MFLIQNVNAHKKVFKEKAKYLCWIGQILIESPGIRTEPLNPRALSDSEGYLEET